jgi:hypothetical protein
VVGLAFLLAMVPDSTGSALLAPILFAWPLIAHVTFGP